MAGVLATMVGVVLVSRKEGQKNVLREKSGFEREYELLKMDEAASV